MKTTNTRCALGALWVILSFGLAQAQPIAQWNFNSDPADASTSTGSTAPSVGAGVATLVGGTTATFASGTSNGGSTDPAAADNSGWNVTTFATQGQSNEARGAQFAVSTVGFQDITVSWDHRHSNTGPRHVRLQYTTDGTTWVNDALFAATDGDMWFNGRSVDLSAISDANDNPNFGIRIVAAFAPSTSGYESSRSTSSYSTSGTWRLDMVTISGTPLPTLPDMRITEYTYSGANGEFVEFTNVGSTPIDMTGWSFDDDSRTPGVQDLSGFGTVQPGESVILTDVNAADFRTAWALCDAVKVVGNLSANLGRNDEINLFEANGTLVDRLAFGDQNIPSTIRTQNATGWVSAAGLGTNDAAEWTLSTVGDTEGSYASTGGDIGSPGQSTRATVVFTPCPTVDPCLTTDLSAHINLPTAQSSAFLVEPVSQLATSGTEIVTYDPVSKRLFSNNGLNARIDIIDFSDPTNPVVMGSIGSLINPNSVAVKNGIVAIADADGQNPGRVVFADINGNTTNTVTVGALPDMIIFSPDGTKVLTANEGEPNSAYTIDPEGSVSVIDISAGVANATVTTAGFATYIGQEAALRAQGIRIFGPGSNAAQDFEPEYITISTDGTTAYVTLQENNAIATIDIATATVTNVSPLGYKDHSLAGNDLDASDRDVDGTSGGGGMINIQNWPILGMYQPDAITSYRVAGETYLLTANEGDARDYAGYSEEVRVGAGGYVLDPATFPNAVTLKQAPNLGRLNVTSATGDDGTDGDFEAIYAFGARSFSIWKASDISQVYDSGDDFEQITADLLPQMFNSEGSTATFDGRSDNKGPEPEAVKLATIEGRTYAFVGLERIGGVMVYDVSDPLAPAFLTYIPGQPGDMAPEDLLIIGAADSPTGDILLVVANEVSNTISTYRIVPGCTDAFAISGNPTGGSGSYTTHAWQIVGGTAVGAVLSNADQPTATLDISGLLGAGSLELSYTVTDDLGCVYMANARTIVEPCVSAGSAVSGNIVWEHDLSTPVEGVAVTLSGDDTGSDDTDANGDYEISTAGGNLTVTPTKTDLSRQGIDVADATRIRQQVLGSLPFNNGYKMIAADVNESNSVTNADATILQQALLGNATAGNILDNPSWRFVDAAHTFANPAMPWGFPETVSLTGVTAPVDSIDFVAVRIGDVNGTWGNNPTLTAQPAIWLVADEQLESGSTHRVSFALGEDLYDVAAWQFALHLDPAYATVSRIIPRGALPLTREDFGTENLLDGELRTVFAQAQGRSLKAGEVAFELELNVRRGGVRLSDVLQLDNAALAARVYDTDLKGSPVKLAFAPVHDKPGLPSVATSAEAAFELYQNVPNPFVEETVIAFSLPADAAASITIHDASGRIVTQRTGNYTAGYNTIRLTRDALNDASGILSYTIVTGDYTATHRMVLVK